MSVLGDPAGEPGFVDTTAVVDYYFGDPRRVQAVREVCRDRRLRASAFVRLELREGYLVHALRLYCRLRSRDGFLEVVDHAMQSYRTRFASVFLGWLKQAWLDFVGLIQATQPGISPWQAQAEASMLIAANLRDAILRAWRRLERDFNVASDLACFGSPPLKAPFEGEEQDWTKTSLPPGWARTGIPCDQDYMRVLVAALPDLRLMESVLGGDERATKQKASIAAVGVAAGTAGGKVSANRFRSLGDALIVALSAHDERIITSNRKDFEPLRLAAGRSELLTYTTRGPGTVPQDDD